MSTRYKTNRFGGGTLPSLSHCTLAAASQHRQLYLVIYAVLVAVDCVSPDANTCAVRIFDVVVADGAPVSATADACHDKKNGALLCC